MNLKITKIQKQVENVNQEQVHIEVLSSTNLGQYCMTDNSYESSGGISNVHRHFYKFPPQNVIAGDKIIVHTGDGIDGKARKLQGQTRTEYHFYCGSGQCWWNDDGDVATLYKLEIENQFNKDGLQGFVEFYNKNFK